MNVLFVDGTAPKPYDPTTLTKEGLGGTEATVIRIAEGLASTGLFKVFVETHNRTEDAQFGALYCKPETCEKADYVIALRYPQLLSILQKRFPKAKHYLWNHDLLAPNTANDMMQQEGFTSIAVSKFHKMQMQEVLKPQGYAGQFQIKVLYNPIDENLSPDSTPVDRNKLLWTSSPHKGLDHALFVFNNLRSFNPDFKLYVANPGYLPSAEISHINVISLGAISHSEIIAQLRSSLCLFYPNIVFPETFGIVLAEANAVGTPVITHRFGAASEVCESPYEVFDCRDPKRVIDRVMDWYENGRPTVRCLPEFRLSKVLRRWKELLK